jgi:hypothetical protein
MLTSLEIPLSFVVLAVLGIENTLPLSYISNPGISIVFSMAKTVNCFL